MHGAAGAIPVPICSLEWRTTGMPPTGADGDDASLDKSGNRPRIRDLDRCQRRHDPPPVRAMQCDRPSALARALSRRRLIVNRADRLRAEQVRWGRPSVRVADAQMNVIGSESTGTRRHAFLALDASPCKESARFAKEPRDRERTAGAGAIGSRCSVMPTRRRPWFASFARRLSGIVRPALQHRKRPSGGVTHPSRAAQTNRISVSEMKEIRLCRSNRGRGRGSTAPTSSWG